MKMKNAQFKIKTLAAAVITLAFLFGSSLALAANPGSGSCVYTGFSGTPADYFSSCTLSYSLTSATSLSIQLSYTLTSAGVTYFTNNPMGEFGLFPFAGTSDGLQNYDTGNGSAGFTVDTSPHTIGAGIDPLNYTSYSLIGVSEYGQAAGRAFNLGDWQNGTTELFNTSQYVPPDTGNVATHLGGLGATAVGDVGSIVAFGVEKVLVVAACLIGLGTLMYYTKKWVGKKA